MKLTYHVNPFYYSIGDPLVSKEAETKIHPTAIIEKGAQLGCGVTVGPYSFIGNQVCIGDHSQISSHVVIRGKSTFGARNKIWSFASLGTEPQDLKFQGEDTELICGDDCMIREYVNFSIGTSGGGGKTLIGSNNLFMVNTHVAHDCIIGNHCIIANGVSLAGHVEVHDRAVLGGHVAIHQFCRIGTLSMIAGGAGVSQDVPPFCLVHGNHAKPVGLNLIGLRRAGIKKDKLEKIKKVYRSLYLMNKTLDEAISLIKEEIFSIEKDLKVFLDFLTSPTKRGICR